MSKGGMTNSRVPNIKHVYTSVHMCNCRGVGAPLKVLVGPYRHMWALGGIYTQNDRFRQENPMVMT
jgi:hypothetical protein